MAPGQTAERVMIRTSPLARRLGVAESTLRGWEARGWIPPAIRTPGGVRIWDRDAVETAVAAIRAYRGDGIRGHRERHPPITSASRTNPDATPLDAVMASAAAHAEAAGDTATRRWLTRLLEHGERASGVVAGPRREEKQRA